MSGRTRHGSRKQREPSILVSPEAPSALRRQLAADAPVEIWKVPLDRRSSFEGLAGISLGPDELDDDELAEMDAYADELLGPPQHVVSMSWLETGFVVATGGGYVWRWPA